MTPASRSPFLRHFGRAAASRRAPDLADMGTAFALDEAIDNGSLDTGPPDAVPGARAAVPVSPWRLWLGRKLGA